MRRIFFALCLISSPAALMASSFLGSWLAPTDGYSCQLTPGHLANGVFQLVDTDRVPESGRPLVEHDHIDAVVTGTLGIPIDVGSLSVVASLTKDGSSPIQATMDPCTSGLTCPRAAGDFNWSKTKVDGVPLFFDGIWTMTVRLIYNSDVKTEQTCTTQVDFE